MSLAARSPCCLPGASATCSGWPRASQPPCLPPGGWDESLGHVSAAAIQLDRLLMPRREGLGQANPGPRSDMRERPALIHLSLRPFAPRALPAQQNVAPMFASRLAPRLESNPSGGVPPRKPMRFMTAIGHAGRCSTSDHFGGPTDRVLVPHGVQPNTWL